MKSVKNEWNTFQSGTNPLPNEIADIAQTVEHLPCKQRVRCSIHLVGSKVTYRCSSVGQSSRIIICGSGVQISPTVRRKLKILFFEILKKIRQADAECGSLIEWSELLNNVGEKKTAVSPTKAIAIKNVDPMKKKLQV